MDAIQQPSFRPGGPSAPPEDALERSEHRAQITWAVVQLVGQAFGFVTDSLIFDAQGILWSAILRFGLVCPPFLLAVALMLRGRYTTSAHVASAVGTVACIGVIVMIGQWLPEPYASRYVMVALFVVFTIGCFPILPWSLTLIVMPLSGALLALIVSHAFTSAPKNEVELIAFCVLLMLVSLRVRRDHDEYHSAICKLRRIDRERSEELLAANAKLAALSATDPLTGLPNRRSLDEELERLQFSIAPSAVTMLMIDVDHFKLFNDRAGHREGDNCLRRIASALRAALRSSDDIVARYGGEEFVAVIHDASLDEGRNVAERMREAVAALAMPHPGLPGRVVTVSIGVGAAMAGQSVMAALDQADRCLYFAKQGGRNRIHALAA